MRKKENVADPILIHLLQARATSPKLLSLAERSATRCIITLIPSYLRTHDYLIFPAHRWAALPIVFHHF